MKVNTISLNSVRLNTIALNHIGEIRSGGGGSKPSPYPSMDKGARCLLLRRKEARCDQRNVEGVCLLAGLVG